MKKSFMLLVISSLFLSLLAVKASAATTTRTNTYAASKVKTIANADEPILPWGK
ncbi:hypothetical protein [Oenococcus sicerae]|uniref:hypothetical protein n=1 Tax=Oenococcus sicerae TaxID=2203724 RepID=UPI0010B1A868|nr:hypothetical protein OAL24_00308 [Oenococcus sicerae]